MKRKTGVRALLAGIAAAALLAAGLGGCGRDPTVATYDGGEVSQQELYNELKRSPSGKTVLANLLIYKALDREYGSSVSAKSVDDAYADYKKQYGDNFSSYLSQNGFTRDSFRQSLRTNLLSEVALKRLKKVSEDQLREAWKTYRPRVTVQHILVGDESTARRVIAELNAGGDFSTLAGTYSIDTSSKDQGGTVTFEAADRNFDSTFKDAAYALKDGEYTRDPVQVTNGYEIIKMVKNPGKGEFKDKKKELTETVYSKWLRDTNIMRQVISQVLKNEHVAIKDKDLADALDTYKAAAPSLQKK
ncbi:peptidylprolyl isomerase PrsA [Scardovia wiggsiae]